MMFFPETPYEPSEYIKTSTGNIVSRTASICKPQAVELPGGRCIVSHDVIVRGDLAAIQINKYSSIGAGTTLRPCPLMSGDGVRFVPMTIGSHTRIGARCTIEAAVIGTGCVIGQDCVLGPRCVLKDFVTVRDGAVVPPDAVVAPFSIIAGAGTVVGESPESTSTLAVSDAVRVYKSWRPLSAVSASTTLSAPALALLLPALLLVVLASLPTASAQCGCCDNGSGSVVVLSAAILVSWLGLRRVKPQGALAQNAVTAAQVLLAAVSLVCVLLATSRDLQRLIFSRILVQLSKSHALDKDRCDLLRDVAGSVLEIGPGSGVNFRCLDPRKVQTLHLVEPNVFFRPELVRAAAEAGFSNASLVFHSCAIEDMPASGGGIGGDLPRNLDFIVGTHVLCSVASVGKTMSIVESRLKAGGRYMLLEHVAASRGGVIWLLQQALQPFFYLVGAGCTFRRLREELGWLDLRDRFDFDLREWDAPVPISLMQPHLIGSLRKK